MKIERLLITGAAGALGSMLRAHLKGRYRYLRLSDRADLGTPEPGLELCPAELADAAAVDRLLEGVDACVHLGGQPVEAPWEVILGANIVGTINLWEAARKAGTKRILFASSNHAIGFYRRSQRIDDKAPPRPDSRYGLSKAWGEDIARYYQLKHGISALCMRIGTCRPDVPDARALSTWQSPADFCRLVDAGLEADYDYEIVYGVSANQRSWWDNSNALRLGYRPQDDAERLASEVETIRSDDLVTEAFQGGAFCRPDFSSDPDRIP